MNLILHIGCPKTGTTTIQKAMLEHHEALMRAGVYAPTPGVLIDSRNGNAVCLANYASGGPAESDLTKISAFLREHGIEAYRQRVESDLRAAAATAQERGIDTILMSNEHCASRLDDAAVQRLADLLTPMFSKVRIVVYLREQSSYALSSYSTSIESGAELTLDEFLRHALDDEFRYDYRLLLERWSKAFGRENLCVRVFEPGGFVGGDLLADFADACGIDAVMQRSQRDNTSLCYLSLLALRELNQTIPRFEGGAPNPLRANLVAFFKEEIDAVLSPHCPRGIASLADPETLSSFARRYDASNRWCAQQFFNAETLFDADDSVESDGMHPGRASLDVVDIGALVGKALAIVWRRKQRLICNLQLRCASGSAKSSATVIVDRLDSNP